MPFEWLTWHAPPGQHPGVAHSQPSVSGAVAALQSARPALHVYVHVAPLQEAPLLWVESQATPHLLQLDTDDSELSQPSASGDVVVQSAYPALQLVYEHVVPLQDRPLEWVESQMVPHAPQLVGDVRLLSQPSESGGVLLQSAQPETHPLYAHDAPLQAPPRLCVVSHELPQVLQVTADVGVSHPSRSGGVASQSAQPGAQAVYTHVVPSQPAPLLWSVSHWFRQPPQCRVDVRDVSQPSVSGAVAALQSARPALQVYVHVAPLQEATPVAVLQATPHAEQFSIVSVEAQAGPPSAVPASGLQVDAAVSHPSVSGAVPALQSERPELHV